MKHVHAELIKAWADGAKIQYKGVTGKWIDIETPTWVTTTKYRIKEYPSVVVLTRASIAEADGAKYNTSRENNLKLTFNGYTGKLKSAEVLS